MVNGIKTYRLLQILSIDVVLGGIASGAMAAKILAVDMPWIWWLALPMSIWVIYTADHLLDAHRLKDQAHTARHLFHHKHFYPIAIIWGIFFLSCISWIAYLVPSSMLYLGFFMGLLVLIHLGLVKLIGNKVSWLFHKELGVGGIYAVGVWGGPVVMSPEKLSLSEIEIFVQFLILALINLMIFSMYEMETDQQDGHTSFVLAIGKKNTKYLIVLMSISIILLGVHALYNQNNYLFYIVQGVYLSILFIFILLSFKESLFKHHEYYRMLGDGVFFIPSIFIFI